MKFTIIAFIFGALLGAFFNGARLEAKYFKEQTALMNATREKELALQKENETLYENLRKEKHEAIKTIDTLRARLSSGELRFKTNVRIDDGAGLKAHEKRAELNEATAVELFNIARDGDEAIRELNYCIDAYRSLK